MTARDRLLGNVRGALSRTVDHPAPPVLITPSAAVDHPVKLFSDSLTALEGRVIEAANVAGARRILEPLLAGRRVIGSAAPLVKACGIATEYSREACAAAEIGVTSADFALADTGTLVFLSEPRLISLLPPRHIAVIERAKILLGLDELFTRLPHPGAQWSSMVLATGPSRTADIEMRLVRGVHGPGDVTVVIIADVTVS